MRLALQDLTSVHPGIPIDYHKFAGLALQRSGHEPPVQTPIDHDGEMLELSIAWTIQNMAVIEYD